MSGYIGLIGSSKAQQVLGKMLEESGDSKLVTVVTSRLFKFKHGCKFIVKNAADDKEMARKLLILWRDDSLTKMRSHEHIPKKIMSFWCNCLTIDYRNALREIKK